MAETEDGEFDNIINVNLRGVWNCMKAELRQMTAQGGGAIVNCSSIGGMRGSKGRAAYSASKFGVIGLTRASALDYADKRIRINAVCPGIIGNTPMATRVTKNNNPEIIKAFDDQPSRHHRTIPYDQSTCRLPVINFMQSFLLTVFKQVCSGFSRGQ